MIVSFLYKIFKLACLTYKMSESLIKSLVKSFKPIIYCARGITLIETVVVASILAVGAFGVAYFLSQTQITMSSSSQLMECQVIAKQALEKVMSLGTRLYGYRIKHDKPELGYGPLLITKGEEEGDSSTLEIPSFYKKLFKELGLGTHSDSPTKNVGVPIINSFISNSHPTIPRPKIEIGTSAMLVNSVNALQYLY